MSRPGRTGRDRRSGLPTLAMFYPCAAQPPSAVARHYGEMDVFYRELWGEHVHHGLWRTGRESPDAAVVALADHVADRARVAAGMSVVDIGCGYGGTARLMAARGATVTGVTITPEQAAYARRRDVAGTSPHYVVADWLHSGLADRRFDAAIAIESTEHMSDKARCFAEAARVLRPGGRLVVCAWLGRTEARGWERRWLLEPICTEGRLPGMGDERDYRALITDAGFVLEQAEDVSEHVRRTWPLCIGRTARALVRDPRYRRAITDPTFADRVFALTMFRIWAAYGTGAMRYVIFTARLPDDAEPAAAASGERDEHRPAHAG